MLIERNFLLYYLQNISFQERPLHLAFAPNCDGYQLNGSMKETNKFHNYETEKIILKASDAAEYKSVMKEALGEMQTLCAGCSKAEPKIFTPPQTPFPRVQDGQNLISWRRSLPSPTDPVW